jgi:hypothetical protein
VLTPLGSLDPAAGSQLNLFLGTPILVSEASRFQGEVLLKFLVPKIDFSRGGSAKISSPEHRFRRGGSAKISCTDHQFSKGRFCQNFLR